MRNTPALPVILALAVGWAWELLSPFAAQAQSTAVTPYDLPIFVDTKGDTIPTSPQNLPFKMIDGFPEYKIGPGDILEVITVEGTDRSTERVRVQPDGTLSFSILTAIPVRNLSLSETTTVLKAQLGLYIRAPQIQIFIQEYTSRSASVFGAITLNTGNNVGGARTGPGIYPLRGKRTALELVMEAGGPAPDARLDQVRLTRQNRTYLIDLQKAITTGDVRQNVILEHGDVIQITSTQQQEVL
ncbi:MAG: polysaccharide export protein [bacterium]|nr:polysaccharide export protein [bacterium]